MVCYDHAITQDKLNLENHLGLLECHQHLGQLNSMLSLARCTAMLFSEKQNSSFAIQSLNTQAIKAAWRLGSWNELTELLSSPATENDFDVNLAKSLIHLRNEHHTALGETLSQARRNIIVRMSGATMDSYQSVYEWVVQLQILDELEQWNISKNNLQSDGPQINDILINWEKRLSLTQPSYIFQEPILHFRRTIYQMSQAVSSEIGKCWLQIAKVCTSNGNFQTASSAIIQASLKQAPNTAIQHAKLLWKQGQPHRALSMLKLEIDQNPLLLQMSDNSAGLSDTDNPNAIQAAKIHLLVAKWMQESVHGHPDEILKEYKTASNVKWEKGHFYLGETAQNCGCFYYQKQNLSCFSVYF